MDRVAIVGDVHGEAGVLRSLLATIGTQERFLIFVGDLINRGPDSREVVDIVAKLAATGSALVLAGNHEVSFLRYLESQEFVPFAMLGGLATIKSYLGIAHGDLHRQLLAALPSDHSSLLRGLAAFWENEEVIVTHAGIPPSDPGIRERSVVAEGRFPELFSGAWVGSKTLVCGHYVQKSGRPFVSERFICLDTGCGTAGGPLTALLLPEWKFVSAEAEARRDPAIEDA